MASAAAGGGGGGGNNNNSSSGEDSNDVSCVYRAVVAGQIAEQVCSVIEEYAQGSDERRLAAVNHNSNGEDEGETPLRAAHRRLARGDLVGVLLEAGADAAASFGPYCNALSMAMHHEQIEALRALLRSGRHDANEELLGYGGSSGVEGGLSSSSFCRSVHLAFAPLSNSYIDDDDDDPLSYPQLDEALSVLVREFGADVNGRNDSGQMPLHWLADVLPEHHERALDALLLLGADLEARDNDGKTPICGAACSNEALVQAFLSRGASADVLDAYGVSPLMRVCSYPSSSGAVAAILRASSPETRRAVSYEGWSAVEYLVQSFSSDAPWFQDVIAELLSSGAPVLPSSVPGVLPIAARVGARRAAEAAAREGEPPPWQVHDAVVGLAFDFQEMREVEDGVRARERRVQELEEEVVRARGGGEEQQQQQRRPRRQRRGERRGGGRRTKTKAWRRRRPRRRRR